MIIHSGAATVWRCEVDEVEKVVAQPQYVYCDDRNQWIASLVCANNMSKAKCQKYKGGCRQAASTRDISDAERERRSAMMKQINKTLKRGKKIKPASEEDRADSTTEEGE